MSSARSPIHGPSWRAPGRPEQTIQAANEQSAALNRLLVVVENYPQLRSSESYNRLMDETLRHGERIAVERMRYNERIQAYNTARRSFPSNLTARIFGFKEYPLFNAPPEAERVPRVDFGRRP
jgi:LemA protein